MSWIPAVSNDQASPEVKRIYEFLAENWGFVPNYFLALGRDPQLLQDQVNLFTHVMFEQRALPKQIKEQVALVVSGINLSNYCLAAHLEILGRMGIEKSVSRKLALDYKSAPVEPKVMELFRFADELTRHPADIEKDRKSTRLNSSHMSISYAVFCLKKKPTHRACRPTVHKLADPYLPA